jgi:hypothetical protein
MLNRVAYASATQFRHRALQHRLHMSRSSARYHEPSVLQQLPDVHAAVTSAASLAELVAFCGQQRLKPTVYTGEIFTWASIVMQYVPSCNHGFQRTLSSPMFHQHRSQPAFKGIKAAVVNFHLQIEPARTVQCPAC